MPTTKATTSAVSINRTAKVMGIIGDVVVDPVVSEVVLLSLITINCVGGSDSTSVVPSITVMQSVPVWPG